MFAALRCHRLDRRRTRIVRVASEQAIDGLVVPQRLQYGRIGLDLPQNARRKIDRGPTAAPEKLHHRA